MCNYMITIGFRAFCNYSGRIPSLLYTLLFVIYGKDRFNCMYNHTYYLLYITNTASSVHTILYNCVYNNNHMTELVRVDFRFPKGIKESLKSLSEKKDKTITMLVLEAVCTRYGLVHTGIDVSANNIKVPQLPEPIKERRPQNEYRCFGSYKQSSGICTHCHYRTECSIITVKGQSAK